jgi:transcriptional regulator with XRE-family HTH domain
MDEQEIYRVVGRRLRQRRRLLCLTQGEVAAACSVSFQQIQKYEAGICAMPIAKLVILAHALEISVSYFVDHLEPQLRQHPEAEVEMLRANAA